VLPRARWLPGPRRSPVTAGPRARPVRAARLGAPAQAAESRGPDRATPGDKDLDMAAPGSDIADRRPAQSAGDGRAGRDDDRPGESVCWLRLVCPECGAMAEAEPPVDCPQCGARIEPAR